MTRIKEKAPATLAGVTSAKPKLHIDNTTEIKKTQDRYSVSNYFKYCKLQGREPNPDTVWLLRQELKEEPEHRTRQEREEDAVFRLSQMDQHQLSVMIDVLEYMVFMDKKVTQ